MGYRSRITASVSVLALSALVTPAYAAEPAKPMQPVQVAQATTVVGQSSAPTAAPATSEESAEKVTVTAQKRAQQLKDVPLPVQSIGKKQLDNSGAGNVADLVTQIPGASVVSKSMPGFETVQIRGVSSGTTGDGLVGYYIDETPFGIPNLQLSPPARLLDVSRVEVIRGPSGTLYGQGSMGGTIKVITATPDSTSFFGTLRGEVSTTDGGGTNYYTDAVVNIPIAKDEFAIRLSGSFESLSGFAELPLTGEDNVNGFKGKNVRAVALWTPSDDVSVTGMYWHIDNAQDFNNGLSIGLPGTAIGGTGGVRGFTDVGMDVYSATLNWETKIGTLTANSSYIDHSLGYEAPSFDFLNNISKFDTTSFTQEVRLASNGDGPFHWLAGAYYRDATIDADICLQFIGFPCALASFLNFNIVGPLTTESWSVFGEGSVELFDGKVEVLAGLRYFEDERGGRTFNRATLVIDQASAVDSSWNPRFNVKWNVAENGNIYFNAAKGFRSGTLQTVTQANASIALGVPTSPQIAADNLWTYEVGTKWQLLDNSLFLEGSVFHTKWKDIQVQFATAAVISVANAGDATINGADLGLVWRTPVEGLQMQFVGSILDTEFDKVVPALSVAVPTIAVGKPVPNVPESNYTISATYAQPQEWLGGLTGSLYAGYAFRNSQIDASTGAVSGKLNDLTLRAGVEGDMWKLEVFMQNALNDDDPAVLSPSSASYQIIYPRRSGLMLTVEF
jgi:iron complex outermembrane recepter protein